MCLSVQGETVTGKMTMKGGDDDPSLNLLMFLFHRIEVRDEQTHQA